MINITYSLEELNQIFEGQGLPTYDRHMLSRLVKLGFIMREEPISGQAIRYPSDALNILKAFSLASNCIYGYGLGSRVDNRNALFFVAKAINTSFKRYCQTENVDKGLLVPHFLNVLTSMTPISTVEVSGRHIVTGCLNGENGRYVIFNAFPEDNVRILEKTIDKDGMPTIKFFAAVFFYFYNIIEGNIKANMFDNTRAFLNFVKNTPIPEGVDNSGSSISDINPLGEKTKSIIPANLTMLKDKTKMLLSTYDTSDSSLEMMSHTVEAANSLTTVLGLLAVLDRFNGNKKDINAWLEFLLRYDNHTLWLTKEIVKPAMVEIGCNVEAFDAKTIYLAAEFMASLGYISR